MTTRSRLAPVRIATVSAVLGLALTGVTPVFAASPTPVSPQSSAKTVPQATTQEGIASFYGKGFHGGPTASGERYDQYSMTAAHRTARFGTRMRVTNLANGRVVVVRINNRGPFARGRVIDLSVSAARALGFVDRGLTRVRLEPTDAPVSAVRTSDVNPTVRSPFEAKVTGPVQVASSGAASIAASATTVAFPLPPIKPALPMTVAANAPIDLVQFLALKP